MIRLPLDIFAESDDFPFHIQYGHHEGDDCYLHGHEDFSELVIVLHGSAKHIVGKESYPIEKGDVFVLNKYTAHSYIDAHHFRICNVMFRPEELLDRIYNIRQTAGFQSLFVLEPHYSRNDHFCSRLRLFADDFAMIQKMLDEIMQEYTEKSNGWQTVIYAMFIRLCAILSRLYEKCDDRAEHSILKLASAIVYLEKHFCDTISIASLAEISGYSERQFSRLFYATFSETPNIYISKLRIQKAQQLLQYSDLTIGEIAWNCGYDDQNYFSRIFKKQTGYTPTAYQKQSRMVRTG